ncbi:MAG: class I SAM-dependent methyltransferase [Pseudomonadota bacterium]|nr:class I SAM-dependent methyltransferase [Pseudomonadota bacterium]
MESRENIGGVNPEDGVDFGFRRVDQTMHTSMVRNVFDSVARRYDLMNDLMSGGLHRMWKAALLDRLAPRAAQTLLDVAGGTGDIATGFLSRGGGAAIICDINEQMMLAGRDKSIDRGFVVGPRLACGDAAGLPVASASVDSCTIVFGLRNVTRRTDALAEMCRTLRPGGHFICMEFSPAVMPLLKPLYDTYSFRVLPWLGARVANDREAYEYLAESIRTFPDPPVLSAEMQEAGFGNVSETPMSGGIVWLHSGWRV